MFLKFQPTRKWVNKVNLSRFSTQNLFQIRAYVICARKAKHLDVTTMFTYSHANTPLGQSERAYYLSYFIIIHITHWKKKYTRTAKAGGLNGLRSAKKDVKNLQE